jgi:hypothetical protein
VDFELTDENGVTSARSAEFVQTERRGSSASCRTFCSSARRAKIKLCDDPSSVAFLTDCIAHKLTSNSIYGQVSFFLVFYMTL